MRKVRYLVALGCFIASFSRLYAQRIYSSNSVLSTGSWYKLGIKNTGVYKIDIPFLNGLGINTANLTSNSIRLFGNGGQMLSEANAGPWTDDLKEVAIQVVDGGDGLLNGTDYILFYAAGSDEWVNEPANLRFSHRKNLFSDQSFYFLSIGGNGKRITDALLVTGPTQTVTSFSERYFHELDTVNFLAGSKEWYGEEMSALPGRGLTRNFNLNIPNLVNNAPITVQTNLVARSVGVSSRFDIKINSQPAAQVPINPVAGGIYDLFAQAGNGIGNATSNSLASIDLSFTYVPGSFNAQGWLNWFELFTRRTIALSNTSQLSFRDWLSVGNNNAEFVVANATAGTRVWNITDPSNPSRMQGVFSGTEYRFINSSTQLKEYIAFNETSGLLVPGVIGKIPNQDLHAATPADLLIVTYPGFLSQATRLAQLHQQNGMRTLVVTTAQVYNEFGSGSPDPTSIRDFVKMYYDKFGASPVNRPKYLLLFGDASFDYKDRLANNTNFVPAYQNGICT
jgi:hypothetical protein